MDLSDTQRLREFAAGCGWQSWLRSRKRDPRVRVLLEGLVHWGFAYDGVLVPAWSATWEGEWVHYRPACVAADPDPLVAAKKAASAGAHSAAMIVGPEIRMDERRRMFGEYRLWLGDLAGLVLGDD